MRPTASPPRQPGTITVEQAAERLGISRSAAYRCVQLGQIPALRLGRFWRVPVARLEAMLSADPTLGGAASG